MKDFESWYNRLISEVQPDLLSYSNRISFLALSTRVGQVWYSDLASCAKSVCNIAAIWFARVFPQWWWCQPGEFAIWPYNLSIINILSLSAGLMVGPALLGYISDISSVQTAMIANAAVLVIAVAIFGLTAQETRQTQPDSNWFLPACLWFCLCLLAHSQAAPSYIYILGA